MGNWFGQEEKKPAQYIIKSEKPAQIYHSDWERDLFNKFNDFHITPQRRAVPYQECRKLHPAQQLSIDESLIRNLLWSFGENLMPPNLTQLRITLQHDSEEYNRVKFMFLNKMKKFKGIYIYQVTDIEKVKNPNLILHYKITEANYKAMRIPYQETFLFHGTKKENIQNIVSTNFDRNCVKAHKFGNGVSFARDAYYATHYSDTNRYDKVLLVVRVLIGNICLGDSDMHIPDALYDTTCNKDGTVYVKYDDSSYYPEYIVHYDGFDHTKKMKNKSRPNYTRKSKISMKI